MNGLDSPLVLGEKTFTSRLIVGTGKYADYPTMQAALDASGAEVVTVAVRRERLVNEKGESLLDYIDTDRYTILPNTAGCYTAEDAIRTCRLAREMGIGSLVKLEVIGDEKTLFPDTEQLLEAAAALVKDGFTVLPYTNDDPIMARKLEDAGCASVMPLGAPIGSGRGLRRQPAGGGDRPGRRAGAAVARRHRDVSQRGARGAALRPAGGDHQLFQQLRSLPVPRETHSTGHHQRPRRQAPADLW